jgi:hypothetical protein
MKTIILLIASVIITSCGSERPSTNDQLNSDSTYQIIDSVSDYETDSAPH